MQGIFSREIRLRARPLCSFNYGHGRGGLGAEDMGLADSAEEFLEKRGRTWIFRSQGFLILPSPSSSEATAQGLESRKEGKSTDHGGGTPEPGGHSYWA